MIRALLGWAALLAQSLSLAMPAAQVYGGARSGGNRNRPVTNPFTYKGMPPEYGRYWHAGLQDPVQAARIEAAAVKRARRADKLQLRTRAIKNMTHRNCANTNSLNPFYVAK